MNPQDALLTPILPILPLLCQPSPLPRKAEGFPFGPNTPWHRWCSWLCRACLGRRRGGSRVAATWAGAGRVRSVHSAAPTLARKHTLSSDRPGQKPPPPLPPGLWSPISRPAAASVLARAPRLRAPSSGFPGSQAARPPGEGRKRWRREDSAADSRQQPACLSCSARGALRLPEPSLQQRPVTLRGRARGAGVGAGVRGASESYPPR